MTACAMEELVRSALLLDRIINFIQSITLLFSIFTIQIYYNNFLALLYMPKYTKSVRKNNMRKNKRGRSRRGGYWFYPSPGDDEHAFTKLRNNFSSGSWKFWQKKPEELPLASDYQPAPEEPMPEQAQAEGSLEYPSPEPNQPEQMDNQEAMMDPSPPMDQEQAQMDPSPPMDNNEVSVETNPETSETSPYQGSGGGRRRRRRATKKRKRPNMRRRTNKRRRSSKRRSR
jgi:hypothetical protein